jgi:2-polyprenyl-3-methyl-5-hydroxy-6-metoxy-1,4-benzoquinol methylase
VIEGHSASSSPLWEEAAECGVCGSLEWRLVGTICGRRYVACRHCAIHRLYDRVAEHRLDLLYGGGYYPTADPPSAELEQQLRNPTFAHRRARLESCLEHRERRILELGCGDGNFLAVLRRHGWEVYGQEFSGEAAALVDRRHHISVFTGDLAAVAPPRPFPVVGAYHVLEHVYHPAAWVRRVRGLVEPGGLLHLQVPNGASLTRHLTGRTWAGFVFPQHVYFYTPETLGSLLERSGFSVLTATTWDPWHGPGTVSRSIYNLATRALTGRLPWKDTIDDREQPRTAPPAAQSTARHPWRAVSRALLESASARLARIEAIVGRGAVVDVIAERARRAEGTQ